MSTDTVTPWIPTDATFASRLALVRHQMGWNIKEAARACGIPHTTWRLWEIDGTQPRNVLTVAKQIAGATGCDYFWLVHGEDARVTGRYGPGERVVSTIEASRSVQHGQHRAVRRRPPTAPVTLRPVTMTT